MVNIDQRPFLTELDKLELLFVVLSGRLQLLVLRLFL